MLQALCWRDCTGEQNDSEAEMWSLPCWNSAGWTHPKGPILPFSSLSFQAYPCNYEGPRAIYEVTSTFYMEKCLSFLITSPLSTLLFDQVLFQWGRCSRCPPYFSARQTDLFPAHQRLSPNGPWNREYMKGFEESNPRGWNCLREGWDKIFKSIWGFLSAPSSPIHACKNPNNPRRSYRVLGRSQELLLEAYLPHQNIWCLWLWTWYCPHKIQQ